MASQHLNPSLGVRAPAHLREAAAAALAKHPISRHDDSERRRTLQDLTVAMLTAVTANPDGFLTALTKYWPEEKPKGRPRTAGATR